MRCIGYFHFAKAGSSPFSITTTTHFPGIYHRFSTKYLKRFVWISHHGRQIDPLKILFCGSDRFSIPSLETLHKLHKQIPTHISSIDVLCRTDKRVGRGLRTIRSPPIKKAALDLGLPVQQIDAFSDFDFKPKDWDLIVAVSFGLLIPRNLIEGAKYGGLNVHPSLLPDLRGAAPIQWAVALGRKETGVSVQTLDPTRFDHGKILRQVSGVPVDEEGVSVQQLTDELALIGARELGIVVERGDFVQPFKTIELSQEEIGKITDGMGVAKAPKVKDEHSRVDWENMDAETVCRRLRAFGKVWDERVISLVDGEAVRVVFTGLREAKKRKDNESVKAGNMILSLDGGEKTLFVKAARGTWLHVQSCKISGEGEEKSMKLLMDGRKKRV